MSVRESGEHFYERAPVVREYAALERLADAEPAILERVRRLGRGARMLDLGVGGGRTTGHFAPLVAEYVGIDYSAGMVAACRERFAVREWKHVSFEVCDARDLSRFDDTSFDFVLFSWNGLDVVGGDDERVRALGEIRRVCRPRALVAFSAHNLNWARTQLSFREALAGQTNPTWRAKALARTACWRLLNPGPAKLARVAGAVITDERRGLRWTSHYYANPVAQLGQLREVGFRDPVALTREGEELNEEAAARDGRHWLYYLCLK